MQQEHNAQSLPPPLPPQPARTRAPRGALKTNCVLKGRYRILRKIASGGSSTVFKAWDRRHQKHVAIKMLHSEARHMLRRFERERKLLERCAHPGVVVILDSGVHGGEDGLPYLVLELLGKSLKQVLSKHRNTVRRADRVVPPAVALLWFREVFLAFELFHAQGVFHRDIKPGNLLFCDAGHLKNADWGYGKDSFASAPLTACNVGIGTPPYCPPEQVVGFASVDARADIYSLAVVLVEVLMGVRFRQFLKKDGSVDAVGLHRALLGGPLPRRLAGAPDERIALHPALATTLVRCLSPVRQDRPNSVGALRMALQCAATASTREEQALTLVQGGATPVPVPPSTSQVSTGARIAALRSRLNDNEQSRRAQVSAPPSQRVSIGAQAQRLQQELKTVLNTSPAFVILGGAVAVCVALTVIALLQRTLG